MKSFLTAALLAAMLAGCAQPDAPAAATPAAVAAATLPPPITGPINGIYQGSSTRVDAKIPACPLAARGLIEIGDRTLLFPYTYELIYVVPVQADGTLHTASGDAVLDGKLIDGRLDFDVTTPMCKSSFSFRRQAGF